MKTNLTVAMVNPNLFETYTGTCTYSRLHKIYVVAVDFVLITGSYPWLCRPCLLILEGFLCPVDGLQGIHGLIQQESGVIDQHVQEPEEVGVVSFLPGQEGRGRSKTCDPPMNILTHMTLTMLHGKTTV